MARLIFASTTVTTATTRVQASNTAERCKMLMAKARRNNAGFIYVGDSAVAAAVGVELGPDMTLEMDFGEGSALVSSFYADASVSGDKVDWVFWV